MMAHDHLYEQAVPNISVIASIFADSTRAAMCSALMSGTAWTVGELGKYCGVSRSDATKQANKLVEANIVKDIRQGKHRYLLLEDSGIAELIEMLGAHSHSLLETPPSLKASRTNELLREGRTCYKHLAGKLGVRLYQQMVIQGYLNSDGVVTDSGTQMLMRWRIDESCFTSKLCLDFSERVFHLGGTLGSAICQYLRKQEWIVAAGPRRCVKVTDTGRDELMNLGLSL